MPANQNRLATLVVEIKKPTPEIASWPELVVLAFNFLRSNNQLPTVGQQQNQLQAVVTLRHWRLY